MNVDGIPWTAEPWLPYRATDHLLTLDVKTAFEWGSGGSTIFLKAVMGVEALYSVEHVARWQEAVKAECAERRLKNITWRLIPPDPGDVGPDKANPAHYKSGSTELGPCNFKQYCSVIDGLGLFDLVLIDGMARASCLKHAVAHVKPGGCLMLDNTDRPYYLEQTLSLFAEWERIDFHGYGPILAYSWTCTAFHNTRKVDYDRS